MAIGTPLDLGHFAGTSTPSSGTITTANAVSTGDLICLIRYTNATTGLESTPTDTAGNTYVQASRPPGIINATPVIDIWYSVNSTSMASSSTISLSFTGSALREAVSGFTVSGIRTTSPVAIDAYSNIQGTNQTAAGALTQNARCNWSSILLVGAVTTATNISAFVAGGSWSTVGGMLASGANVQPCYQIKSAQSASSLVAFAPTWTTSAANRAQVWGFIGIGSLYLAESTGLLTLGVSG